MYFDFPGVALKRERAVSLNESGNGVIRLEETTGIKVEVTRLDFS